VDAPHLLDPEAVAAICRHMNDDHAAEALLICRHLGNATGSVHAEAVGVDVTAMHFRVRGPDGTSGTVRVPFAAPVGERAEVRSAVVELYERASAAAGAQQRSH
jgi:putative heme iron utilization protein